MIKVNNFFSPNFKKKERSNSEIKLIVLHYTGMQSERESLLRLTSTKSKVSCHYLINLSGKIYKLVEENRVAWHAGKSCWGKFKNVNQNSIGIELVNKGHQYGYTNFKKKQLESLIKICSKLIKKYKIKKNNIIGHSDVAPLRKKDPGERFPWKQFADKKIGIWHNHRPIFLKKYRKVKISKYEKLKFIKITHNIGYCFSYKNKSLFFKTIKAFQRRYRKELINGLLDKECILIAQNISKKL